MKKIANQERRISTICKNLDDSKIMPNKTLECIKLITTWSDTTYGL